MSQANSSTIGMDKNEEAWNKLASIHYKSKFYGIDQFIENPSCNSLNFIELAEIGDEIKNKSILHLQCHIGQDTISLLRAGAKRCVGLDFSEESLRLARELAKDTKCDEQVTFLHSNVYNTAETLNGEKFDMVFTSYGVLGWLPDLESWATAVFQALKPGGTFYIAEFHPLHFCFDFEDESGVGTNLEANPKWIYPYLSSVPDVEMLNCGTYADESVKVERVNYNWNHGLGTVITALIKAGFKLDYFNEHLESPYTFGDNFEVGPNGGYVRKGPHHMMYPLIYSIHATKQAEV